MRVVRRSTICALAMTMLITSVVASTTVAKAFNYDTKPPVRLAVRATGPLQFPTPSQCVALFGLACYTPAEIRKAYDIPSALNGSGQVIVIVDAYGSPTIRNDLHVFDQTFSLPDPTLNIVYPTGKPTFNPRQHHNEASWAFETSIDVEWSHAIAPRATIDLVIAANNAGDVLNLAQGYAVSHHLGNVMSLSFGLPEAVVRGNNNQLNQARAVYQAAAAAGITVFAASGDTGATNGFPAVNPLFPSSDPLVTAIGGTNLFIADDGTYESERVWNDSVPSLCPFGCTAGIFGATGGAPSILFATPSYQSSVTGFSTRTTSDVSYNASVYTGILTFISFPSVPSGFYFTGGTSEGAPQWAAIIALADEKAGHALGLLNPALYAIRANAAEYAADFHDVVVGNNGFFGPGFSAGPGYDLPTGLGTPRAANLISTLAP